MGNGFSTKMLVTFTRTTPTIVQSHSLEISTLQDSTNVNAFLTLVIPIVDPGKPYEVYFDSLSRPLSQLGATNDDGSENPIEPIFDTTDTSSENWMVSIQDQGEQSATQGVLVSHLYFGV